MLEAPLHKQREHRFKRRKAVITRNDTASSPSVGATTRAGRRPRGRGASRATCRRAATRAGRQRGAEFDSDRVAAKRRAPEIPPLAQEAANRGAEDEAEPEAAPLYPSRGSRAWWSRDEGLGGQDIRAGDAATMRAKQQRATSRPAGRQAEPISRPG
jgi:hypothetical protein